MGRESVDRQEDVDLLDEEYHRGYTAAVEEARPYIYLALGAMRSIALNPVLMGMAARVRDHARQNKQANPLILLQSAHAKCVHWKAEHGG